MLVKSALVTQMSGSIGGMTAGHNSGGMYLRARGMMTNPNSPAQISARAALEELVDAWNADLTQVQRDAWNLYASNTALTNKLGDPHFVSGMAMYVRGNTTRIIAGLTRIDDGPTTFSLGPSAAFTISGTEATQEITTTLLATPGANVSHVQIQLGRPQNPGRLFFRGPYRLQNVDVPGSFPLTATPVFAIAEGQRIFATARAIMTDGRLAPKTFASALVGA